MTKAELRALKQLPPEEAVLQLERVRLQRFADNVRNEEHWQQILATTESRSVRDELEREVGPLLAFRQCRNKRCETHGAPVWEPVLELREVAGPPKARLVILLPVCEACKDAILLSDVLTEDLWQRILGGFVNLIWIDGGGPQAQPTRHLTTLTFQRRH